jgi:hypothetical protein
MGRGSEKIKIDKWINIKLKGFWTAKDTVIKRDNL